MGELLDRELQKRILADAAERYPGKLRLEGLPGGETRENVVNSVYLHEHDMLAVTWKGNVVWGSPQYVRITAKGLDFLANDGGLSAVLGVVTVKLHDDTIRGLLLAKLETSSAPIEVRQKLAEQIKTLPAEALKEITLSAMKSGLQQIPDVAVWLAKHLSELF
ncbi:hypothetical protein [Rhizobium sp. AAP43]|uniref:hypothetical protein n=1 Tax=Rhizobium sp. AAP43 TaxID=1523420 RepID=UPI0006B9DFA9|nr:hypothetical protein [Rhizobium sp. AAP43]KPF47050.1 hypothetical protein IP76_01740 [Rhizobium sp. AAP43]